MINLRWIIKLLLHILWFGFSNKSIGMSLTMLVLLLLGVMVLAIKVAAPFIYTLF